MWIDTGYLIGYRIIIFRVYDVDDIPLGKFTPPQ
jgi:hypothetical protein